MLHCLDVQNKVVADNFNCMLVCDMLAGSFQAMEPQAFQQGKSDLVRTQTYSLS